MSRGQFGAQVGVPRLLDIYKRKGITTSFFVPAHAIDGYYHENPTFGRANV
jgi:peptidoglycan-N-acetylglucosamine deacetylase